MKRINSLLLLCLSGISVTFSSCNEIETFENSQIEDENVNHKRSNRIKKTIFNLNADDAKDVARLFKSSKETRSLYSEPISVVSIMDDNGEVKIYAVNFIDGYMFVSATKNYYPILAMIDHGTYSDNNGGEKILIRDMLEAINSDELSVEAKNSISREWCKYEEISSPQLIRAGFDFDDDDYEDALYILSDEWWENSSGRIYKLTDSKKYFTDEEYNSYCARAEGEWDDLYGGTKFSWEHTAMIAIVDHYDYTSTGTLLKTKWHQRMEIPFNTNPLGCLTIAVGQTMRYFEFPANAFNWDVMYNDRTNMVTSDFLKRLKSELNVDEDGFGNIKEGERVLNSYGYKCSLNKHNSSLCAGSVRGNKPVIQNGYLSDGVGHTWVCDGVSSSEEYTEYHLVGLGYSDRLQKYTYVEYESNNNKVEWYDRGTTYYHMNWGEAGSGDGWYLDALVDAPVQYSNNRWDLIVSPLK